MGAPLGREGRRIQARVTLVGRDYVDRVIDADGQLDEAAVRDAIVHVSARAAADAETFEPPVSVPDEEMAMAYLRSGAGQAIGLYIQVRTGGRRYPFAPDEFERLEGAMNTWFELYAACYGVELTSEVSLRTAAQALIDTDNIRDVARIVTGVPE